MVMADNFGADVVFLIEATAHISPYVESLKTNYIIPTLEYFGGTSIEEREFNVDNIANDTLYGIVTFMSMDCKPDSASMCYAPTSNSCTFLQWLDKIQFIGGAGDPSSHIVEGLSTAINLFDDFKNLREKNRNDMNSVKSSKFCILICNSTPYLEPSNENPIYCGFTIDQLMNIMVEKNINFSVFSPRKMNFLYKLFENAGGSLHNALTKNYAKDRRHLVLLNGFHLQEKPVSPSVHVLNEQEKQQQGIKRSLSPANANSLLTSQQIMSRNQQMNNLMTAESAQFAQHSKIASDNIVLQARVGSPSNRWPGAGSVPSPSQAPRNPTHPTPVRARASTPQMGATNIQNINPTPSPGQMANLVPQPSPASKASPVNQNNSSLRPTNAIRPQQAMQSPFPAPQAPSPSQPQQSPLGMRAVQSPLQNSAPSPISQPQQFIQQQQINQISQQHMNQIPPHQTQTQNVANINQMNNMQQNLTQNMNPAMSGMMSNQRTRIWSGVIEFYDKTPQALNNPQAKIPYLLDCQMTYHPNSNDPEFKAERWPEKLILNTVSKTLVNRLSPIFKNNSYQVNLHFNIESQGYPNLIKALNANMVGCIQMPNPAIIRIIIVFYLHDKKLFVGYIPHNQNEFVSSMKELIESHRKEQQVKQQQQKMLSHMQIHQQQQQMQQPPQSSTQVSNTSQAQVAQISGPMSIQIMHGQIGQTAHSNASQILSSSNPNTMFQSQQISSNANIAPSSNPNINTVTQSNPVLISANSSTGTNILLNQSMGPMSNANQAKNATFITNNTNLVNTSNAAIQIMNSSPATGINQLQPNPGQQMIQQNAQPQQTTGQQFNIVNSSAQINIANNSTGFIHDRQQNLNTIKQLMQNLEEAQRKEIEYQQQQAVNTVDQQPQMMPNPNALQQQNSAVVRQHLQQQLQQKQQMIHLQQQQQQQQQVNINNNAQLRHLLQQQQMRVNSNMNQPLKNINPTRMHLQQGSVGVPQPQQSQILLQQIGQMGQQQQIRFQSAIQAQPKQQPQQQQAAPSNQPQQHRGNFFDESLY